MTKKTIATGIGAAVTILLQVLTYVQPVLPASWGFALTCVTLLGTVLTVHILPEIAAEIPTLEAQAKAIMADVTKVLADFEHRNWLSLAADKDALIREVRAAVILDMPVLQTIAEQAALTAAAVRDAHPVPAPSAPSVGAHAAPDPAAGAPTAPIPTVAPPQAPAAPAAPAAAPAPTPALTAGAQAAADLLAAIR